MVSQVTLSMLVCLLAVGAGFADPPASQDYSGDCTRSGCHDTFAKLPVIHDPIGACDSCHELDDETKHRFKLTEDGGDLCLDCHDEFEGKFKHGPAADGSCTTCHDPHASKHRSLLVDAQAEVCAMCHEEITEDRKFLHGPVAAGDCGECHDPHASDHAKLLDEEGPAACLGCHEAMGERLADSAHVHSVAKQSCTGCHDPHGAENRMFARQTGAELCLSCHDDIGDAVAEASIKHSAVTVGQGCAACHDPHASSLSGMLTRGQLSICMSCHDKPIETARGTLTDMKALLADSTVRHGPIADGDCVSCHVRIHGGERLGLLGLAYPMTFYVGYDEAEYELCFDCHDADAFSTPETEDATQFRNGTQNLHYLHVSRQTKGRACRACHLVHASKGPHLLAETVPFGQWQLPIGFQQDDAGGTCASGCHRVYRYDWTNRVINVPPGPQASARR